MKGERRPKIVATGSKQRTVREQRPIRQRKAHVSYWYKPPRHGSEVYLEPGAAARVAWRREEERAQAECVGGGEQDLGA